MTFHGRITAHGDLFEEFFAGVGEEVIRLGPCVIVVLVHHLLIVVGERILPWQGELAHARDGLTDFLVGDDHLAIGLAARGAQDDSATAVTENRWKMTNRWIGANILGDTGGLTGRGVEDVAEDTGRLGVLGVLASSAGKLKLVSILVLLGIKHVGAFGTESEGDLLELLVAFGALVRGGGLGGSHLVGRVVVVWVVQFEENAWLLMRRQAKTNLKAEISNR